ncbi:hypothetical protein KP509_25G071500 [Ceratopteris richardii]|nr:hypothetical protein KP509_25G071500 [Ceratopteris richardii]
MYLKQMSSEPGAAEVHDEQKRHKRKRAMLGGNGGEEEDPALRLTLSLPTSSDSAAPPCSEIEASSEQLKLVASSAQPVFLNRDHGATTTSPNEGSPSSCCSSSSPSQYKQLGCQGSVGLRVSQHNQESTSMRAAGCPHCFMFVLPSKSNPKCPRCNGSVLVDLSPLTSH